VKKIVIDFWLLVISLIALIGCATTGPRNESEAFPLRNQDPTVGLIINESAVHLNLYIYDEAGRLIEEIYLAGVNRHLTINGQSIPRYWARKMEIGRYRVEIYPFYYRTEITNPLFGKPARYRVDLPKRAASFEVNKNPTDYYYGGRHWGWILRLNGGHIPETAHGLPGINLNFQGEAWKLLFGQ
jgi:hypothetical protein